MTIDAPAIGKLLGGRRILKRQVRTTAELAAAVRAGLPVKSLDLVAKYVTGRAGGAADLKHRIVPKTTLQRRTSRLSTEESERLERLAWLMVLAERVWEDEQLAREFLLSPQPHLDDERPVDLVATELGARLVEDLLWKLEYSLPA